MNLLARRHSDDIQGEGMGFKDDSDLLNELEGGSCRTTLGTKALRPHSRKAWHECYLLQGEDTNAFYMYDEVSCKLLFTAIRASNGDYYISQYEDFPENFVMDSKQRKHCAVLRLDKKHSNYKLFSCSCELCDNALCKFKCDSSKTDIMGDRQQLGIIKHTTKRIDPTDVVARVLDVELPALLDDETQSRVVWCPRTKSLGSSMVEANRLLRRSSSAMSDKYQHEKETEGHEEESKSDCDDDDDDDDKEERSLTLRAKDSKAIIEQRKNEKWRQKMTHPVASKPQMSDRIHVTTKLPCWNKRLDSLVLSFRNGRVTEASRKNVILEIGKSIVFQLGRRSGGQFSLDFKHPISPLQAFAVSLSEFGFIVDDV